MALELNLAYKTQILFVIIFGVMIYVGYNEAADSVVNYKRGLQAALFVLVAHGMLRQYNGPFIKALPVFWRGVARYNLIYLSALVFLLFQTASDARELMKHLYPELGKPVTKEMHTYDDHCDLNWKNFSGDFDHYYAMHLFGWFFATLLIRDAYLLHFWSVLDEILELSWQHILPHFRECWWDHILTDLLLSNTPAIMIGLYFIKKTGLREFDWLGRKGKRSVKEWEVLSDHRRFGGVCVLLFIVTCNFLSGFFLINSLWIPPVNYLNVYRLSVWFFLGSMAIGELHDDVESWGTPERKENPISNEYRWMVFGVCILEAVISYKFRHGTGNLQDAETPLYITIPWTITILGLAVYYLNLRLRKDRTTKYGDTAWEIQRRQDYANALKEVQTKEGEKKAKKAKSKANKDVEKVEQAAKEVVAKVQEKVQSDSEDEETEKAQPVKAKGATNGKQTQKVEKVEEPKKLTGRRLHDKKALGEVVPEEPAKPVVALADDEWRTIPVPKGHNKKNKKKRE